MGLKYNISYELAAIPYMMIVCAFMQFQYNANTELNHRFRLMTYMVFVADVLDVVTAVTISYGAIVPRWLNMLLNTGYIISTAVLGNYFLKYVVCAAMEEDSIVYKFFRGLYSLYYLFVVGNLAGNYIFYFDAEGNYIHGPFYVMIYIMPIIYLVDALIILLVRHERFEKKSIIYIFLFSFLSLIGPIIQILLVPTVLFSVFTVSLAVLVMLFSLETPDYQRLQQAMRELARTKEEADQAKEAAQAANQAKSDFLASMSHELRTPINAVMGMNEMVLRESSEENIREYAHNIQSASQSLLALINDTLDFSKIEAGKMEIVPYNYQLSALLSNVVTMIAPKAKQKNLDFEVVVDKKLPVELYGDEMRIKQIMVNLLNNAIKYTKEGCVYFTVRGKNDTSDQIQLKVSVTDTGIGIQEQDIPRLFQNFERLNLQKNRNVEGTGLGLAITHRLTEQMGGEIHVSSVYGEGSTFTLYLPQRVVNNAPIGDFKEQYRRFLQEQETYRASFTAKDARILVVDDNRMNLMVVQGLLKKTGIQIETASSGRECLSKIVHKHYDVVFLDHMMPDMDGIETLEHAKRLENSLCKATPFIALTAHAIEGMREMYLGKGFDDYLSKPVESEKLEAMLMKYLPIEKVKRIEP